MFPITSGFTKAADVSGFITFVLSAAALPSPGHVQGVCTEAMHLYLCWPGFHLTLELMASMKEQSHMKEKNNKDWKVTLAESRLAWK